MSRNPLIVLAISAAAATLSAQPDARSAIVPGIEARRTAYADIAKQIWGFAEVGYQEEQSSALLQRQLKAAGFEVASRLADTPTAFVATWGSGKPIIGIVGEFDALPGLSQEAQTGARKPLVENGAGHGCGHNLLGTGALAAAIAVKDWLIATRHAGTIRYYGTPAEEGGSGKVYMIRAGLFKDADAIVSWHPGDRNEASPTSSTANVTGKFRFRGVAAHAAAAPDRGRSALDAVEAMDYMVNMMREHVPQETRIHYIITSGGKAPNVVPDFAEAYYYARHGDMRILDGIWERIVNAAKGAALGTGTTMDFELVNSVYNVLPNDALADVMQGVFNRVGGYAYTAEEKAFAEQIRTSLTGKLPPLDEASRVSPPETGVSPGSTDMGDLSWVVPTVQLSAATWVPGTPAHSWQAVAAGGMSIGAKGMMVAAKTMALTAIELFNNPAHLPKARAEFEKRLDGFAYKSRVGDRKPPLDYRR